MWYVAVVEKGLAEMGIHITLDEFLMDDFSAFDEWRKWPPEVLATYVVTMKCMYDRLYPEQAPRAKPLSSGRKV